MAHRLWFGGALLASLLAGAAQPVPDVPDGTCAGSLQSLIDAAEPWSVLEVPPCLYRESATISKPLVLRGQPGAQIRGSDVWTNWRFDGTYWVHGTVPYFPPSGQCQGQAEGQEARCLWPEQVVLDGVPLQQVGGSPRHGQFAQDPQRNILLADDPSDHVVEVTTRDRWLVIQSDNVTVEGFSMQHASNSAQTGALSAVGFSHLVIQRNVLGYARGAAVHVTFGSDAQVLNNEIHHNEELGIISYASSGLVIRDNYVHDNNTKNFDVDWSAGGIKLASTSNVMVEGNEIAHNNGNGFWCDITCKGFSVTRNRVHHNARNGILSEVSDGAIITDNLVWENGWGAPNAGQNWAIFAATSANVDISGNVLGWNAQGIGVLAQVRPDAPVGHDTNIHIANNSVIASAEPVPSCAVCWFQTAASPLYTADSNNHARNNRIWYSSAENGARRFAWNGDFRTLGEFAASGSNTAAYMSDADKTAALALAGIPDQPEQHALPT
jgi:parallel beta-helix repeat protein